jgi:hypothetical protein
VAVVPKYLNFAIFAKDFLDACILVTTHEQMAYLVFSDATSARTSLLASNGAFVFFFMVFIFFLIN